MKLLLILALFAQSGEEKERIDLLKRVAPALVGVEGSKEFFDMTFYKYPARDAYGTYDRASGISTYAVPEDAVLQSIPLASRYSLYSGAARKHRPVSSFDMAGFFVDDKGTFVTVTQALAHSDGKVRLPDGQRVSTTILAKEEEVGLAVVKIEGASTPLPLADSSHLEAGRTLRVAVLVEGSPVLRSTVLIGRQREGIDLYGVEDFLHLDYPALPSEAGSPVLSADGQVVGILAQAVFESIRWEGSARSFPRRAYAIPSNTLRAFLDKIKAHGKFEVGVVGVQLEEVENGIRIQEVTPRGAAEKGGLKVGDIIGEVNGRPVRTRIDLERVTRFKAHEEVEVALSDGRKLRFTVGAPEPPPPPEPEPETILRDKVGMDVMDVSDDLKRFLDLGDKEGTVIVAIQPGSPAEAAGLRKGDVIRQVDNEPIKDRAALLERMKKAVKASYVVFETISGGKKVAVVVTVR